MEIKAHEYAALIRRAEIPYRIVLVFGPDRGLVSERAAEIAAATRIDLKDDFSVVRLEAAEIAGDAGRLIDEARSVSLFGGERLVWVRNAGGERGLADAVKVLADGEMTGSRLIIEAGDLKKSAALRKIVIEAKTALGIPAMRTMVARCRR
jgi:DNA polymerase III, delta subunit